MKVNYRHQLCAANFATLQLWRRRSLSGNCTTRRQSPEKVWARCGSRRRELRIEFLKSIEAAVSSTENYLKPAVDAQLRLRSWESESGRKWKWKEHFLRWELPLLLHFRICLINLLLWGGKMPNLKSKSTKSYFVVFKYSKKLDQIYPSAHKKLDKAENLFRPRRGRVMVSDLILSVLWRFKCCRSWVE